MTIADDMVELALRRLGAWETTFVDDLIVPLPETVGDDRAIVSDNSVTYLKAKRRIILKRATETLHGVRDSVFSFSRDYLKLKYPNHRKRSRAQMLACRDKRPPQACIPCQISRAAYVDLRAAWWVLCQAAGWDVDYDPTKLSIRQGVPPSDYPFPHNKMGRSSLISSAISVEVTHVTREGESLKRLQNPSLNYSLWGFVMDALGAVAQDAIDIGAMYVNNDGFIIPMKAMPDWENLMRHWLLPWSVKAEGQAQVWGPGRYSVGRLHSRAKVSHLQRFDNIQRHPQVREFMADLIPSLIKGGTIYL